MKVTMTVVKGMTSDEAETKYPRNTLDYTCSTICQNTACREHIFMSGSWYQHTNKLMECPKCGRITLTPYLRKDAIEELSKKQRG
jgi:hypothetical protein